MNTNKGNSLLSENNKGSLKVARIRETVFYACVVFLPMLQFVIMYVWVNINSFLMGFQKYDVLTQSYVWNGVENFKMVFRELTMKGGILREAILPSILSWLLSTVILTPFNLLLPFYIYKKMPASEFFKVVLYLPAVLSGMVVGLLYKYVVDQVIPELALEWFGRTLAPLASNMDTRFMTLWLYNFLSGFGGSILIYVSLMSRIPESLVEYAKLEGCTPMKEFLHITFPLIFPTWVNFFIMGLPGILSGNLPLFTFFGTSSELRTVSYYLTCLLRDTSGSVMYPKAATIGLCQMIATLPLVIFGRLFIRRFDLKVQF